ncbi:MAG: DoxX family protein [Burkholderiales bacterium]|nr:DoxX family protein [Burkholderiales bacterium]
MTQWDFSTRSLCRGPKRRYTCHSEIALPLRRNRIALDNVTLETWRPRMLAVLRIVTAYLFLQHGTAKLLGIPAVAALKGGVPLLSLPGAAGTIEIVGGVLLLIGLFTRPTAFILCGEMAFAYFIGHASKGNTLVPLLNGGELAVMFCFVFLYFAVAGAGAWSVDAARRTSAA